MKKHERLEIREILTKPMYYLYKWNFIKNLNVLIPIILLIFTQTNFSSLVEDSLLKF